MPSATVPSKRQRRPSAKARSFRRVKFQATGPLLTVMTSMPSEKAVSMWAVACGAPASCSMTVASTRMSACAAASKSCGLRAGAGRPASPTRACSSPARSPFGSTKLPCRVPTPLMSTCKPKSRSSSSSLDRSTSRKPRATVPKPRQHTFMLVGSFMVSLAAAVLLAAVRCDFSGTFRWVLRRRAAPSGLSCRADSTGASSRGLAMARRCDARAA